MESTLLTCSESDCQEPHKARGFCRKHYNQWLQVRPDGEQCVSDGCESIAIIKGMCQKHYSRQLYLNRKAKVCSVDGCGKVLWALGFCKLHWDEDRRLNPKRPGIRLTPTKAKNSHLPEDMGMAIEMEKIKDVLTSGDVAKICNVAARTVTKWIDNGSLQGYRIPGSKDRRVTKIALINFMKSNGMPMYIAAKRNAILYGFEKDAAEIIKKLTEEELGINIHLVNDTFTAGVLMSEKMPSLVIVDYNGSDNVMSMLKALELSTAEIVVATDDPSRFKDFDVNTIKTPYRVRDVIEAITQYI